MHLDKLTSSLARVLVAGPLLKALPPQFRETFFLRAYSFLKIPVLSYVNPSVIEINESRCVIRIRLRHRTRNHLGSMYFGVLAVGADCAGGLIAMRMIGAEPVALIFKDFKAEFLKRAEGDVLFTCEDGLRIRESVQQAMDSGERNSIPVQVTATVPSKFGQDPVAIFHLTLSLKKKEKTPFKKA